MAGDYPAMIKETLTFELDRKLYNSWCSIGTALNLTTNSQIAHYLILCYQSQDELETKKTCETCGAMLTQQCALCKDGKYSQNAQPRKQPSEKDKGHNLQNPGQTVQTIVKMETLTNESDAVHSGSDYIKNETVGYVVGVQSIDHDQSQQCCDQSQQCRVGMLLPLKESVSSPSSVSQAEDCKESQAKLVNCEDTKFRCEQARRKLKTMISLLKKSESASMLHGASEATDINPGGLELVQEQTKQKLKKLRSVLKTSVKCSQHLSYNSVNANKGKCKRKLRKQQYKQTAEEIVSLPKACTTLPSTALPDGNAVNGTDNVSSIVIVFPNKSLPPQTNHRKPVKMVSLLKQNNSVSSPAVHAVNPSNVKIETIDLAAKKYVEETTVKNSLNILSHLTNNASIPFTKYSTTCNTNSLSKCSNDTKDAGDKSMQEGSKPVPVILLSLLKESVTLPSSLSESADVVGTNQTTQDLMIKSVIKCDTLSSSLLPTNFVAVTDEKLNLRHTKQTLLPEVLHEKLNSTFGRAQEGSSVKSPVISGGDDDDDDNVINLESGSQQNVSFGIGNIQQLNSSVSGATEINNVSDHGMSDVGFNGHGCRNTSKNPDCEICKKIFANARNLRIHKNNIHNKLKPAEFKDVSDSGTSGITSVGHGCGNTSDSCYCDICKKTFSTAHTMRVHKNSVHHGLKPFQCDICGQTFPTCTRMRSHQLIHSDAKPHQCALCEKSFKSVRALKSHSDIHSGLKSHVCEGCGKRFQHLGNLRRHTRTVHLGLKRFVCNICGKAYARSEMLKYHKFKHSSRPFYRSTRPGQPQQNIKHKMCDTCGKWFDQHYIKLHKMTHTGEKPHVCQACGRGFVQYISLKQHELVHTGQKPYVCKICNKAFSYSNSLKEHKLIHEKKPVYLECEVCGKKIKYHSNLCRHLKKHQNKGIQL